MAERVEVDRDVLRYLLLNFFRLDSSESARISILNRARLGHPEDSAKSSRSLDLSLKLVAAHQAEQELHRSYSRGFEDHLLEALAGANDDAFRNSLRQKFLPGSHCEE